MDLSGKEFIRMKKSILITLAASIFFVNQSFADVNSEIEVRVNIVQENVNAVVNIAENCEFTGWMRGKKEVYLYATCNGIKKSITVKDAGLLNSFVVKKVDQEVSIRLDVYKSSGLNWDKLNQALSGNNSTEE